MGTQGAQTSANAVIFPRCVRQVAALYGKESLNPMFDPAADPDHHQNLIASNLGEV